MKRILALILAVAMIASMSMISLAVSSVGDKTGVTLNYNSLGAGEYAIEIDGEDVTFTNCTITSNAKGIKVTNGGSLTLINTTITAAERTLGIYNGSYVEVDADSTLTTTTSDDVGIFIRGETGISSLVTEGTISAVNYFAISGNGLDLNETSIEINGGSVTSEAVAIYHPQPGSLVINDGAVTGATGIYMKDGDLEVNGGTITGNGADGPALWNGNGCNTTGDAIVVDLLGADSSTGYGVPTVSISGGAIQSVQSGTAAFEVYMPVQGGSDPAVGQEAIDEAETVLGGTLAATDVVEITGGAFSDEPDDEYIADGAIITDLSTGSNGNTGTLTPVTPGNTTYPTLTNVSDYLVTFGTTAATKADATVSSGLEKYGTTLYVILGGNSSFDWITSDKTAGDLKASATWTEGGEYVKSVEVVKKKVAKLDSAALGSAKTVYMVAISTVSGTSLDDVDVSGKVYLKGRSGNDKNGDKDKVDAYFYVDFTLGYETAKTDLELEGETEVSVANDKAQIYDFSKNDETEFVINYDDKFTVTANVAKEKKVLLATDYTVIDEIDEAYPEANIDYYAFTGAFKKTTTVEVDLAEGEYLYAVVDGQVVEVNGEYDDWAEVFTFKTKKLGTYIISDVELDLAEEVVVANPSTGAAA